MKYIFSLRLALEITNLNVRRSQGSEQTTFGWMNRYILSKLGSNQYGEDVKSKANYIYYAWSSSLNKVVNSFPTEKINHKVAKQTFRGFNITSLTGVSL